MEKLKAIFQNRWVLLTVVLIGLTARMAVSTLGYNFDMKSYFIVASIVEHGGNVYSETTRYNYGPIWFQILHLLDILSGHHQQVLRYIIALFLSLVDIGIFLLLCRFAGGFVATLFFLNPISILITGFNSQFDNLAVGMGLLAVQQFGNDFEKPVDRRKLVGLAILGLSLMTKHLLFAFPIWLAIKQRGFLQKLLIVAVPSAMFLAGFLPYWSTGHSGIIENVFRYHSHPHAYFFSFFLPAGTRFFFDSQQVWLIFLFLFGLICRRRNHFESLLLYTGVLVATSPATTNHYLAIPVALAAVFPNPLFLLYTVVSTYHTCVNSDGLHWSSQLNERYDDLAIYTLGLALLWLFWRRQIEGIMRFLWLQLWLEINVQRGRDK